MNPAYKNLQVAIEKATHENLSKPEIDLLQNACNAINSRADMPKESIKIIKKRLQDKNSKVQYLALELLELATFACELNFHSQVASRDFLLVISTLVNQRQLIPQVQDKILYLVQLWARNFDNQKDILPGFQELYTTFRKKGLEFPANSESKYASFRKAPASSFNNSQQSGGSPANTSQISAGKEAKLKKDLEIVKQNVQLTNEIIDACDPKEDVTKNEILTDLINTLKQMENKFRDLIVNLKDENMLRYCLELNDDINKTFERYKELKKGRKPQAFSEGQKQIQKEESKSEEVSKPVASQFDDFFNQPVKSEQKTYTITNNIYCKSNNVNDVFGQGVSTKQTRQPTKAVDDLLTFDEAPNVAQAVNQKKDTLDLLGDLDLASEPTTKIQQPNTLDLFNQEQPQQNINQPNQQKNSNKPQPFIPGLLQQGAMLQQMNQNTMGVFPQQTMVNTMAIHQFVKGGFNTMGQINPMQQQQQPYGGMGSIFPTGPAYNTVNPGLNSMGVIGQNTYDQRFNTSLPNTGLMNNSIPTTYNPISTSSFSMSQKDEKPKQKSAFDDLDIMSVVQAPQKAPQVQAQVQVQQPTNTTQTSQQVKIANDDFDDLFG